MLSFKNLESFKRQNLNSILDLCNNIVFHEWAEEYLSFFVQF